MDFRDVDDLNLGDDHLMDVNLCLHMNDRLGGHLMGASRVNRNCVRHDLMTDGSSDVNRGHHMNDRLGDHSMGDDHRDVLVGHRMNVMDDRNDLNLVVTKDVNRDLRTNDPLDDLNLDVTMDVSRDLRMNDQLDDHLMDGKMSHRVDLSIDPECYVLVGHRMNVKDDRKTDGNHVSRNYVLPDQKTGGNLDASRVNRNCVRRDRKMDVNLDAMSHHVMLMGDQSKSCDRMSHDHLQCDHRMMRRHDTSRNLVVMILDVNHPKTDDPMHLRRVNRRMKVCPKMDDRKMI